VGAPSRWHELEIEDSDPEARRARIAGSCLLKSIDTATQKAGLVFPSGVVSHTGASGLILGGGTGWLTRRFGLSCDNVEGFTLVTADSSVVSANSKENPDLFWALSGGGGNFGVVTEFEVKLHALTSMVLAEGLSPEADIRLLLECWRDFMAEAPLDLKWNINLRLAPHARSVPIELRGRPVASSSLVWTGEPGCWASVLGARAFHVQSGFCQQENGVVPESANHGGLRVPAWPGLLHQIGYFTYLGDSVIDRRVEAVAAIPSSETQIELACLGGAQGRERDRIWRSQRPFIMNLPAGWSEASADAGNISWIRGLFNKLRPAMKPGVYVNFMSGDEQDRVPEAYQERRDLMVAVKTHYYPRNLTSFG
jgi:hypothetical protein